MSNGVKRTTCCGTVIFPGAFIAFVFCTVTCHAQVLVFPPYGHSYGIRKATPAKLFMFFGPRTSFSNPQGIATAKMVSRDDTTTEHDDDEVIVYGVNTDRHQLIYNTSMWTLALFGKKGSGREEFLHPLGIAVDAHGNVYVADSGNDRIVHLFNPRHTVEWKKSMRATDPQGGQLDRPTQVALDSRGFVYVVDAGNHRVVVLDSAGTLQHVIHGTETSRFNGEITGLAVADGRQRWSFFKGDRFFVCADRDGRRLWKFTLGGSFLDTLTLPAGCRIAYGAVDFYHNAWFTDTNNHRVYKFSRDLVLLERFGSAGKGDNEFIQPRGIAIHKRYGQVFIAEKTGAQYYWVGTHLMSHSVVKKQASYSLELVCSEYSFVSLFALDGADTARIFTRRFVAPGGARVNVRREAIERHAGRDFHLKVEPTYSSYTYFFHDYPVSFN